MIWFSNTGYLPVSLDEVVHYMKKNPYRPVDHHA